MDPGHPKRGRYNYMKKDPFDRVLEAQNRLASKKFGAVNKTKVQKKIEDMKHKLYRSHDLVEFLQRDSQACNWTTFESSIQDLRRELDDLLKLVSPGVRYEITTNVMIADPSSINDQGAA